jgi:hypothetical protein
LSSLITETKTPGRGPGVSDQSPENNKARNQQL